jgi:hypothetical protein
MMPVEIRLGKNGEGQRIKELLLADGVVGIEGLDWSRIEPYWLVADLDGEVVGCLQVCLGLPMGRLELLATDKEMPHRMRATVVRELLLQGVATLTRLGAGMATGMVSFDQKAYKKMLRRRGAVVIFSGNTYAKLLK